MPKQENSEAEDTIKDSRTMEDLLNALGVSANYLSKKVGVSHGAIFHIKNGVNHLSNEMIDKIIMAFPNVSRRFLKHKELPILLSDQEMKMQMETLNLPSNNAISVNAISKFIGLPNQLDRIEEKIDLIMEKLGIDFDGPDEE
ncbi:helix-turn-helix transcriptional regulator [Arenibacter palladensis]|uniref:helix-turn-helix transcriptional regulator n=1 Tax=Arenibacter palladensis TaxID=237373 RepID=UPI002FD669E1